MTSKEAVEKLDWVLHKLADAIGINFSELEEIYGLSDVMEVLDDLVEKDTRRLAK